MKRFLQLLFSRFLAEPEIPRGKTVGYALVRSQKAGLTAGEHSRVNYPCNIIDVSLGDWSYIAPNSNISNCSIGKFCSIGPNFCCGLGMHPTQGLSTSPMFYSTAGQNGMSLCSEPKYRESEHTAIGNDVFVGANVTVLDGVTIGDGAVIGAGAVVTADIPPYAVAVGVPARVVKYRFPEETVESLLARKWWDGNMEELKKVEDCFYDVEKFLAK